MNPASSPEARSPESHRPASSHADSQSRRGSSRCGRPWSVPVLLARWLVGGAAASLLAAAHAGPFPIRDQNPFATIYGLPTPLPARLPSAAWTFETVLNSGTTALIQTSANESLIADAETRELRVTVDRGFGKRWAGRLEIPYR